ncbi:MAG: response regulator transcription factor [Anaerolineaceae bacterium]|nr:response regulator transcription factor [Anaerolineaceae bacterium]
MTSQILIVDDHGVIRAGLQALLDAEPDLQVVGEAENSEKAIEMAGRLHPDIVLMDISMPGANGIEATRQICEKYPSVHVLILTVHEDRELLQEALRCGASGYVLKQAVKSELINAIHAVARGDIYVHSSMTRALLNKTPLSSHPDQPKESELTLREMQIVRLVAKGYTNQQIGELLHISVRTVEYHRGNVMDKLGLESRVELVRYAAEHDI